MINLTEECPLGVGPCLSPPSTQGTFRLIRTTSE